MTTTPTDDLPPLPEPDMWIPHSITELSASYTADQMRAYALADRQARAAQGEPVATLHDDGCFTWKRDEYRLKYDRQRAGWRMDVYATPPAQPKAEPPLTESERAADHCRKCGGLMKPGKAMGQTVNFGDEGTCSPAGPGVLIDCLKCEVCGWSVYAPQPEQQSTAQPVASFRTENPPVLQRLLDSIMPLHAKDDGVEVGWDYMAMYEVRDAIYRQGDFAAPPRTDAPALTEANVLLSELWECGAVANWLRVSDDLKARIERALRTASKPTGGKE